MCHVLQREAYQDHNHPKTSTSMHPPKSPCSDNVDSLLAEINLPISHFDNVLKGLRPPTERGSDNDDTLDNPCILEPPTDKNNQMTQVTSPTEVDTLTLGATSPAKNNDSANDESHDQQTPSSKGVQINETATEVKPSTTPARLSSRCRKLILHSNNNINPLSNENNKVTTTSIAQPKEIHNCSQKLSRVFSADGMEETSYHAINFTGLYPIWPIVEFSMSPTGNTKDERMSLFTKCITALLGKMLYVNNKARIAPIAITDNDGASYILDKANLPTNFTKLGKHIMISGEAGYSIKKRGSTTTSTGTSGSSCRYPPK